MRIASRTDLLEAAGRCTGELVDRSDGKERRFVPFIGSGSGGSSALYGMALERFFPSDFVGWPVDYEAMKPSYAQAEALFRVRGSPDPLRAQDDAAPRLLEPPPMTPGAAALFSFLQSRGLHPYRLPQACEFVAGCQGCQGFLCARDCKNDSDRVCLRPAVREHGAALLDECTATAIEADRERVTGLLVHRKGASLRLVAKTIVLAAGALQTPALLLRSRNAHWPDGLANRSGLVGRRLMRHFIDLYLLDPLERTAPGTLENRFKELAFNDFYAEAGAKLGSVQSFGRLPPAPMLLASMRQELQAGRLAPLAPLVPLLTPFLRPAMEKMVSGTMALATILEDTPRPDNRVIPGDHDAVRIEYRIGAEDLRRIERFRAAMAQMLKPHRYRLVKQAWNNERIAHACGTCRFGDDPAASVLDRDNRAHGVKNLHVVDASFFPTSGGTNPALTIAANALRVAARMGT